MTSILLQHVTWKPSSPPRDFVSGSRVEVQAVTELGSISEDACYIMHHHPLVGPPLFRFIVACVKVLLLSLCELGTEDDFLLVVVNHVSACTTYQVRSTLISELDLLAANAFFVSPTPTADWDS